MYSNIEKRSKSKNLPCLSKEEFINFTIQNSLKIENLYKNWKENKFMQKLTPSVDRINPNLGYIPSNIQFLTYSENTSKGNKERARLRTN